MDVDSREGWLPDFEEMATNLGLPEVEMCDEGRRELRPSISSRLLALSKLEAKGEIDADQKRALKELLAHEAHRRSSLLANGDGESEDEDEDREVSILGETLDQLMSIEELFLETGVLKKDESIQPPSPSLVKVLPSCTKETTRNEAREQIPSYKSEESEFGPETIAHAAHIAAGAANERRPSSGLQTRLEIPSLRSVDSDFGPDAIAQAAHFAANLIESPAHAQAARRRPSSSSRSRTSTIDSARFSARPDSTSSNGLLLSTQKRTLRRDPLPEHDSDSSWRQQLLLSLADYDPIPEAGGLTPTGLTPSDTGSFSAFTELANLGTPDSSSGNKSKKQSFEKQKSDHQTPKTTALETPPSDDETPTNNKEERQEPPVASVLYTQQQQAAYAQMYNYQQQASQQARAYFAMQQYTMQQHLHLQQLHYQQQQQQQQRAAAAAQAQSPLQQPGPAMCLDPSVVPTPIPMMMPPPHLQQLHLYMLQQQQQMLAKNCGQVQQQQQPVTTQQTLEQQQQQQQQLQQGAIVQQLLEYQRQQQQLFFAGMRPQSAVIPSPPPKESNGEEQPKKVDNLESDHAVRSSNEAPIKQEQSVSSSTETGQATAPNQRSGHGISLSRFLPSALLSGRDKFFRQDSSATVDTRSTAGKTAQKTKRKFGPIGDCSPLSPSSVGENQGGVDDLRQSRDSHFGDNADDALAFSPISGDAALSPKKRAVDDFYQNCPNSPSSPSPTRAVRCDDTNSIFRRRSKPQSRFASVIVDPVSIPETTLDSASGLECPCYDDLINFARSKGRGAAHLCVMCGRTGRPPPKNSNEDETTTNNNDSDDIVIIPTQNKDVCKTCDTVTWRYQETGALFKWCKGCKRFHRLAAFAGKLKASKCDDSRARGRAGYMRRKEPALPTSPVEPTVDIIAPTTTTVL